VVASFRLIAATNRDLAEEVRAGRFRSDLFYRLHVCPVRLPSLRERRGDIPHLFRHFWTGRGETRTVEPPVMQCLASYDWPGNVRELENLVERVSVCAEGDVIRLIDLPLGIRAPFDGELEAAEERGRAQAPEVSYVEEGIVPAALLAPTAAPAGRADVVVPSVASDVAILATAALAPPPAAIAPPSAEGPTIISLKSLASMASELREAVRTEAGSGGQPTGNTPTPILQFPIDLPTMLRDLENRYINAALAHTGSNKKEAAKLLGMGRTTLVEKLRRRSDVRPGAPGADGAPVAGPDPD
jgi:sigma-54 specific flagellar transcriptional regulator A